MEKLSKLIKPAIITAPFALSIWGGFINQNTLTVFENKQYAPLETIDIHKNNEIFAGRQKANIESTKLELESEHLRIAKKTKGYEKARFKILMEDNEAFLEITNNEKIKKYRISINELCLGKIENRDISDTKVKFSINNDKNTIDCKEVNDKSIVISKEEFNSYSQNLLLLWSSILLVYLIKVGIEYNLKLDESIRKQEMFIESSKKRDRIKNGELSFDEIILSEQKIGNTQIQFDQELVQPAGKFIPGLEEVYKQKLQESKLMSPKHQESIILLVDYLAKVISNYYKSNYNIELGNIDLTSHTNFCYTNPDESETIGAVQLQGKQSNNLFFLREIDVQKYHEDKINGKLDVNSKEFIKFCYTIIHEIHHKLFNLDNRLEPIIGENPTKNLISKAKREGFVDCLARRCSIFTWQNIQGENHNFRERQIEVEKHLSDKVNWLNTDEYNGYVLEVEDYLYQLARAYWKSGAIEKSNDDLIIARAYIDKLFVEFFLAADRKIIDLAKSLGVKNILDK